MNGFIVFSDDWGEHPSSCQHLFRHIAKRYKVLWVNTIGMRNPKFTRADLIKAQKKIRKMVPKRNKFKKDDKYFNLKACQPFMLPYNNRTIVRIINTWSVVKKVRECISEIGLISPIMVVTVPNACDYIGKCGEKQVVYYCVDDFPNWPGLNKDMISIMEEKLITKSDLFISTSSELHKKFKKIDRPSYLLTHGVELNHFKLDNLAGCGLLSNIPKPRVGYCGLFDERSNKKLIAEVARLMPEVSIVITGKIETEVESLRALSNVYFTGPVLYSKIPKVIKGFDILFLPYVVNDLTKAISPLKLKEYLASGKPIVSTPIPEVGKFSRYLTVARSPKDWKNAINSYLDIKEDDRSQSVIPILNQETWEYKSKQFVKFCQGVLS